MMAPAGKPIRVLLVDDNALFLRMIRSLLVSYADIEVIGEAADGEEALKHAVVLQPAIVLMDVHLRKTMDGIAATRLIIERCPDVVVLGLSWDTREYVVSTMRQVGAFDVLPKDVAATPAIYEAIHRAVSAKRRSDEGEPGCGRR